MTATPYRLLTDALRSDAARPLVTYYDDATGERVELSVATYENWVAKTANLLQDELAVEPGDRVGMALPPHWQATVVPMACWAVGAVLVPVPDGAPVPPGLAVVFAAAPSLPAALAARAGEVIGLSLRPLGGPLEATPPGVRDFAVEVPGQGDRFAPYAPPSPDDPALAADGRTLTGSELAAAGRAAELPERARVLSTRPLTTLDGLVAGLLGPLAAGGSVVLCRNADPERLAGRRAAERVTVAFH